MMVFVGGEFLGFAADEQFLFRASQRTMAACPSAWLVIKVADYLPADC